ncbi:MAG: hypothetical protein JWM85_2387 [Acidimicrobiaceae bacterium]|nr:hypothetical protein [Acidimicrobiaceae bacterium]
MVRTRRRKRVADRSERARRRLVQEKRPRAPQGPRVHTLGAAARPGSVIAAAVVRIGGDVQPRAAQGEGWPKARARVALQTVSAPPEERRGVA